MDAAESYIARQLVREPGLRLLPVFLPPPQRGWVPAWVALLGELDEAMFEVSDPRVAQTKLAWWGADLAAGARAQHPLSKRLMAHAEPAAVSPLAWRQLIGEALRMALLDHAPVDWSDAQNRWEGVAAGVAEIESQLFARAVTATLVREQWQWQRVWSALRQQRLERSVAPLPLQALKLGDYPVHPLWEALAQHCSSSLAAPAPSLQRELLRVRWWQRLRALRAGRSLQAAEQPAALSLLWQSWRGARRVTRV